MIVNMTARCGSTLIAQIMSEPPNSRSLSEPLGFDDIVRMLRHSKIELCEFERLIQR